jgi:hypothetical protein
MTINKTKNLKNIKKDKLKKILQYVIFTLTFITIVSFFLIGPFQRNEKYQKALEAFEKENYQLFSKEYENLILQDQTLAIDFDNDIYKILKANIDIKVTPNIENGINYFNRAKSELRIFISPFFQDRIKELSLLIEDYRLLNQSYKLIKEGKYNDAFISANTIKFPDKVLMTKVAIFFASNQTYLGGTLFKKIILEKLSIIEVRSDLEKY